MRLFLTPPNFTKPKIMKTFSLSQALIVFGIGLILGNFIFTKPTKAEIPHVFCNELLHEVSTVHTIECSSFLTVDLVEKQCGYTGITERISSVERKAC